MVKIIKVSLFLFLLALAPLSAQQITVKASTDTSKYKVGDYITYKLLLTYNKNLQINYPSIKDSIKNLEFIKEEMPVKHESSEKVIETRSVVFSKYDSSIVRIPSYKISYLDGKKQGLVTVNPVTIIVETVQVDTTKEIQDVKAPVEIPFNWVLALIIFAIVAILATTGVYIYKYYKKKNQPKTKEKIIIISPYELALKELHTLDEKHLWQEGRVKEYHSEITEIIRKYFEGRFNFMALEMTTSEVLKSLQMTPGGTEVIDLTEKFLNNADLVKFAKFIPIPTLNTEMMSQAVSIVYQTVPVPVVEQKKEGDNV
jgi:hypothetical protein